MIPTPLHVGIVGSGPAAMYAVQHLLDERGLNIKIDIIEKLPTPWGLVRSGVAPDHPEKKLVVDRLFAILMDDPRVRFIGNVEVGVTLTVSELTSCYHGVIIATGAAGDVRMGIEGEALAGCASARQFVSWYNGHPDYRDLEFDLTSKRVVIVGNGNVALDVARILVTPIEVLERTDIADHALEALRASEVQEVVVLGRRGLSSVAFNNPELDEFEHLDVNIELEEGAGSENFYSVIGQLPWVQRRKVEKLRSLAARPRRAGLPTIRFEFQTTPIKIIGTERVEGIAVTRSTAVPQGKNIVALVPEDAQQQFNTRMVLRAIGYCGMPFAGMPFDDLRRTIANVGGRIVDGNAAIPGIYVTGWIKRGCRGLIGTNKRCSEETIRALLEDAELGLLEKDVVPVDEILARIGQASASGFVRKDAWKRIDRAERIAGRVEQRPRVKLTRTKELLDCAGQFVG